MTPDNYTNLLYGLAGVGIAGFVGYTVSQINKIKDRMHQMELEVRDKYVKGDQFTELKEKVDRTLELLYELCGKLGVPIRRE